MNNMQPNNQNMNQGYNSSTVMNNMNNMNQQPMQNNNQGKMLRPKIQFKLPMSRRDPMYEELEAEIIEHIEYANLELDFHKVEEAQQHLETAAYYLRNIVD